MTIQRNRPITAKELQDLGDHTSYYHKYENRQMRKAMLRDLRSKHNNRKASKSRVTQIIPLKMVVGKLDSKLNPLRLVDTGRTRTIRKPNNYIFGGNNTRAR